MRTLRRRALPTLALAALLCFTVFAVTACSGDDDSNKTVAVTSIIMSDQTLTIEQGQTETLEAFVNIDATNKAITWSSDKETIATVDGGEVTAVSPGEATITATSVDNPSKTASCTVTVTAPKAAVVAKIAAPNSKQVEESVTDASLFTDYLEFRNDGTYTMYAKLGGALEVTYDSTWAVNNDGELVLPPDGFSVNAIGMDFPARISVESFGDRMKVVAEYQNLDNSLWLTISTFWIEEDDCVELGITVGEPIATVDVTGITLSQSSITLLSGKAADFASLVQIQPANATEKGYTVAIKENADEALKVDGNSFFGFKEGTAVVTITTKDGEFTADCTVTVTFPENKLEPENYFTGETSFAGTAQLSNIGMTDKHKIVVCKTDGTVEIYDDYTLAQYGYYTLTGTADEYTKIAVQLFADGDGEYDITESSGKMTFDMGISGVLPIIVTECEFDAAAAFDVEKVFEGTFYLFDQPFQSKRFTCQTNGTLLCETKSDAEGGDWVADNINSTYSLFVLDGDVLKITLIMTTDGVKTCTITYTEGVYSFVMDGIMTITEQTEA